MAFLVSLPRIAAPPGIPFCSIQAPEEYAFERNVTRLGADLGTVESIVLSHGHWDHAGAMLLALGMIRNRNGGRKIPYYAHPGMFHSRGVKLPNGTVRRMEDIPSVEDRSEEHTSNSSHRCI